MALPQFVTAKVESILESYCDRKVPIEHRDKLRVCFKIEENSVTLYEERPAFMKPGTLVESNISNFQYDAKTSLWTLYCRDQYSHWHKYDVFDPSLDFDDLLQEVEEDPTGIFWG